MKFDGYPVESSRTGASWIWAEQLTPIFTKLRHENIVFCLLVTQLHGFTVGCLEAEGFHCKSNNFRVGSTLKSFELLPAWFDLTWKPIENNPKLWDNIIQNLSYKFKISYKFNLFINKTILYILKVRFVEKTLTEGGNGKRKLL